ncbi:MAG: HEAT repeat domain-containing protein [Halobacteriota archaeon]
MDSTIAGFIAGAVISLISGTLALVATNYKDFQRRWNERHLKKTMRHALGVLKKGPEAKTAGGDWDLAVSDIVRMSKEEDYATCFDWDDREQQAEALGECGGVEAVDALKRMVKDKDVDVRIAAVTSLGKIDDSTSVPALISALKDKSPYIRSKAVVSLGTRPTFIQSQNINDIALMLYDVEPTVRRATAETLGYIGEKIVTSYLVRALRDNEWYVRREAAQALGRVKDPAAIPYLIRAYQTEEDPDIREAALAALKPFDDPRVAQIYQQALDDEDSVVRMIASIDIKKVLASLENNVLILSGETDRAKAIVDVLRNELSTKYGYTPLTLLDYKVINRNATFQDAVRKLAHMSRFLIADITASKATVAELQAIAPEGPPIALIMQKTDEEDDLLTMLSDQAKYRWVLGNIFVYNDADDLVKSLKQLVIDPLEDLIKRMDKARSETFIFKRD